MAWNVPRAKPNKAYHPTMANGRSHIGLQKWLYAMYLVATA
ncbi:MAG: hypothetical protein R1F54_03350 [Candidatus Zeuxoniibacter abyssi]|nr:MAG: hypothetical protein R1F54_09210 [Candidatus Persebacteraceae bacterium AB1(2)]WOV91695.1 MAG: hypothetical protein R1F54_03350 [Candidatus Persebacteraceae bacterium AB1(2)]